MEWNPYCSPRIKAVLAAHRNLKIKRIARSSGASSNQNSLQEARQAATFYEMILPRRREQWVGINRSQLNRLHSHSNTILLSILRRSGIDKSSTVLFSSKVRYLLGIKASEDIGELHTYIYISSCECFINYIFSSSSAQLESRLAVIEWSNTSYKSVRR